MARSFGPALAPPAGLEAFSYRPALRKPLALEREMEREVELMVGAFIRLTRLSPIGLQRSQPVD